MQDAVHSLQSTVGKGKDEVLVGPTPYDDNIFEKQTVELISKMFLQRSRLDYTNRLKTMATTTTGHTPKLSQRNRLKNKTLKLLWSLPTKTRNRSWLDGTRKTSEYVPCAKKSEASETGRLKIDETTGDV